MIRTFFITAVACFFCSHAVVAQANPEPIKKNQPNIIFILTDDLGWGDLGVFYQQRRQQQGKAVSPFMFTPHLDTLAKTGARLMNDYCAAPVCAPSRGSLLSGLSQGHANVRDNQFDKAIANNYTLGTLLQKAGYATAAIGKWGLQGRGDTGPDWTAHPLNRGFDYFIGYMRHEDGHEHYPKEGIYDGPKEVWLNRENIAADLDNCYTADLWTAAAKHWITGHEQGPAARQPFFMYLAFDTPHAVLELPTGPYPGGGGLGGGLQWKGQPGQYINTASGEPDTWVYPDYANARYDADSNAKTPAVPWPRVYQRYATAVRRIDDAVGDLMQLLKDLNIDDNTLVVFTSDNGPSIESYLPKEYQPNKPTFFKSFGPFDGIKRDCWEGGIRMPGIVNWPAQIKAGTQIETPTISYDWLASFAEAAGYPVPALTDGRSLIPILTGKTNSLDRALYIEYFNNGRTPGFSDFDTAHRNRVRNQMQWIRIGDTIGVRYDIKSAEDDFEIYDVTSDPGETHNLAVKGSSSSLQKSMKAKVLQMRMPNAAAPRPYDLALVPAIATTTTKAGIRWKTVAGNFPWLPDLSLMPSQEEGQLSSWDEASLFEHTSTYYCLEGYIDVPEDGSYQFFLNAQGNALLKIHESIVIDAGYGYFVGSDLRGDLILQKGLHPFKVYYSVFPNRKPFLELQWSGPGFSRQAIPGAAFLY